MARKLPADVGLPAPEPDIFAISERREFPSSWRRAVRVSSVIPLEAIVKYWGWRIRSTIVLSGEVKEVKLPTAVED